MRELFFEISGDGRGGRPQASWKSRSKPRTAGPQNWSLRALGMHLDRPRFAKLTQKDSVNFNKDQRRKAEVSLFPTTVAAGEIATAEVT